MAAQIGLVSAVTGKVIASTIGGRARILQNGDEIFFNEVITTSNPGAVVINFNDNTQMVLGRESSAVLNEEIFSNGMSLSDAEIALLQQGLIDGNDPTLTQEATAAGADEELLPNSGPSSIPVVNFDASEVLPTSGFETVGLDTLSLETGLEELIQQSESTTTIPNSTPSLILKEARAVTASEFTATNHDTGRDAAFQNSYGYYVKTLGAAGNVISDQPTIGVVLENDVKNVASESTGLAQAISVSGYSEEQIGYFILSNGGGRNANLADGDSVSFVNVGGNWTAVLDKTGTQLSASQQPVTFDNKDLNADGVDHVVNNPSRLGNQNWEDLVRPPAGRDFTDVNMDVSWTKVTVSGEVVDSIDFGLDTKDSIDFTLDSITESATPTSDGKAITFEARDTDADGVNDQIVGFTDEADILTIKGIIDGIYSIDVIKGIDDLADGVNTDVDLELRVTATDDDGDTGSVTLNVNLDILTTHQDYGTI